MTQTYAASIQRNELSAAITICVIIIGGLGSLALAKLSGAVVTPGTVIVQNNTRKVQNVDGGTVTEIRIKNGDRVAAGDVMLRLDSTEAEASLEIAKSELEELRARKQRLMCESIECPELEDLPLTSLRYHGGDQVSDAWAGQAKLLEARRNVRINKKKQLIERVGQLEQAREAFLAQAQSNERQAALTVRERAAIEPLYISRNVPLSRMLSVEREEERVSGEAFRLKAELRRVAAQIAETRLQIAEVDQTTLGDVLAEVRDVSAKEAELVEKISGLKARRDRTLITAPSAGIVHNLSATTVQGVVKPGEIIAEIVPQEEALIVEARVEAGAIDRLQVDQTVYVRFISFDQRATPVLLGKVSLVAPDANQDQRTGQTYYVVQVWLNSGEMDKLAGQSLRPGMPCEVQFQTGERTILSYLMKPFEDQMSRGLRER
jgi:HlyD family secretion protein